MCKVPIVQILDYIKLAKSFVWYIEKKWDLNKIIYSLLVVLGTTMIIFLLVY